MVFRGIPLEQARQRFEEIKGFDKEATQAQQAQQSEAKIEKRRKLKLDRPDNK
jgi:hypothetical protein